MQNDKLMAQEPQSIAIVSKEKYLKLYNPNNCLQHAYKLKTVADAIHAKALSVAVVKRDCGEEFAHNLLMAWLVYLNELLGVKNTMSENQIRICASHLLNEFYYLKFSELSYVFQRIITGEYGELYESITIAKITNFFRQYDKERTDTVVQEREQEHSDFRYSESKNETPMDIFKRGMKKRY